MTLQQIEILATEVRKFDEQAWGTGPQIDAENALFDAVEAVLPDFDRETFCLRATTDEMVDEALRLVRAKLSCHDRT